MSEISEAFKARFQHFDGYKSPARQDDLERVFKSGAQWQAGQSAERVTELETEVARLKDARDMVDYRRSRAEYVRASKERNPDVHEDGLRDDDGKVTRHIGYSDLSMRALADETGLEWVVRPVWYGPWVEVTGDDE